MGRAILQRLNWGAMLSWQRQGCQAAVLEPSLATILVRAAKQRWALDYSRS